MASSPFPGGPGEAEGRSPPAALLPTCRTNRFPPPLAASRTAATVTATATAAAAAAGVVAQAPVEHALQPAWKARPVVVFMNGRMGPAGPTMPSGVASTATAAAGARAAAALGRSTVARELSHGRQRQRRTSRRQRRKPQRVLWGWGGGWSSVAGGPKPTRCSWVVCRPESDCNCFLFRAGDEAPHLYAVWRWREEVDFYFSARVQFRPYRVPAGGGVGRGLCNDEPASGGCFPAKRFR